MKRVAADAGEPSSNSKKARGPEGGEEDKKEDAEQRKCMICLNEPQFPVMWPLCDHLLCIACAHEHCLRQTIICPPIPDADKTAWDCEEHKISFKSVACPQCRDAARKVRFDQGPRHGLRCLPAPAAEALGFSFTNTTCCKIDFPAEAILRATHHRLYECGASIRCPYSDCQDFFAAPVLPESKTAKTWGTEAQEKFRLHLCTDCKHKVQCPFAGCSMPIAIGSLDKHMSEHLTGGGTRGEGSVSVPDIWRNNGDLVPLYAAFAALQNVAALRAAPHVDADSPDIMLTLVKALKSLQSAVDVARALVE